MSVKRHYLHIADSIRKLIIHELEVMYLLCYFLMHSPARGQVPRRASRECARKSALEFLDEAGSPASL